MAEGWTFMATVFVCVYDCANGRYKDTRASYEHLKVISLLIVFQTIRYSPDAHAGMSHVQALLIADTRLCMFRMHLLAA